MSETNDEIKTKAVDAVRNDPAGSVKRASAPGGRDHLLLSAIALCAQDAGLWQQLRDAGVVNLFITLLVDEWKAPQTNAPGWVFSLTGLINALVSLKRDEKMHGESPENSQQTDLVRKAYSSIENTLWKNRETADTDDSMSVLALGFYHLTRIPGLNAEFYTPATLSMVAHCWTNSKSVAARKVSCVVLRHLLSSTTKPPYALNNFFKLTPPDAVFQTLLRVFLDNNIRSDMSQLGVELLTADSFVEIEHPSGSEWARKGLHSHVMRLVQAGLDALESQPNPDEDEKAMLVSSAAPLINNVINAAENPASALQDLIEYHEFFDVASRSLLVIAPREDSFDSAWFRIFKMLIHTIRCTDVNCRVRGSPEFTTLARTHFKPIFLPTLDALDQHIGKVAYNQGALSGVATDDPKSNDKNKDAALWQSVITWRALAAVLNIHEEVVRGIVKVDEIRGTDGKGNVCWWAKCTAHKETTADGTVVPAYKRCSACRTVMYCSAEHQKLDWKEGGHKQVCAVISNA